MRLARSRRPAEKHVGLDQAVRGLFRVRGLELPAQVRSAPIVVVTQRHAEHFLRLILPYDESIQVLLHLLWLQVKVENALQPLADVRLRRTRVAATRRLRT
eukprot:scaffold1397_cov254-Pinguiococcus_pyrenoidosus.AAC.57